MANAKIENLLNLSLDSTPVEREKSLNLGTGYSPASQTWEVIVRYVRDGLEQAEQVLRESGNEAFIPKITMLSNSYAVLVLPEALVDVVANLDGIIYMEKPKRLFFAVNTAKRASCITAVQSGAADDNLSGNPAGNPVSGMRSLSGKNCIVAVIDSGERVIIMSS